MIAELYKKHVNMLVQKTSMKPEAIQPTEGNFTWGAADRLSSLRKMEWNSGSTLWFGIIRHRIGFSGIMKGNQ